MPWTAKLPPELDKKLKPFLSSDEKLQFCAASDMSERMDYAETWLVATDKRVLVYGTEPGKAGWQLLKELTYKGLGAVESKNGVGGGTLVARKDKRDIELIRFSNSLAETFGRLAKVLNQLAKRKPFVLPDEPLSSRCPKCGRLKPNRQDGCPFCIHYLQAMRRILGYLLPHKVKTLQAVGLTTLATCLQLLPPLLQKKLVDEAIPNKDLWLLGMLVLTYVGINLAHTFIEIYNGQKLAWLGGRLGTDIRRQVFGAVERLSLTFFDKRTVGQIMSRVMKDSGELQQFLIDGFPYLANNAFTLIGIIAILSYFSPTLTVLIMIPVPLMFLAQRFFWRMVKNLDHKAWNQYSLLNTRLNEQLSGMRVVKAFSQETREAQAFDRQNDRLFAAEFASQRFWKVFFPGMFFFIQSGILIVWYVGAPQVMNETMTLGAFLAFIQFLWMFYGPLQWFQQVNNWMTRAFVGAERIFEIIDAAPEAYDPKDAVALPVAKGAIEFRNVSFSYEKGSHALKNVSFTIKPGELIGLVGRSGSGKSTMLALLCRFYEPDEGEILVDGIPLAQLKLEDLRRNIGLVLQEPFLFGASIRDNLCYSKPDAGMELVVQAARAANAHEFIMAKNDAYDTRVGERGNRLSGGEKQRLSIARAILHDPRILIMDEATSSVDSETEFKIQQAMDRLASGRTTLVAAHRLSTLRHADRIFVMEAGKLMEQGSHEQLMRKHGRYCRMVKVQEKMWRRSKRNIAIAQDGEVK